MRVETRDQAVWSAIAQFLSKPSETILALILKRREQHLAQADDQATQVERLTEQLATLLSKEGTYADMFGRDMLSPEVYRQKCAEITVRRQKLQGELARAQAAVSEAAKSGASTASLAKLVDGLKVLAQDATPQEQRELVRKLVARGGISFKADGEARVACMFDEAEVGAEVVSERSVILRIAR